MRVKKFVPNKKGDIGMEVTTYVNPTPMSLPSLLLTKFTSNDIHRCWVDIGSIPPFLCPLLYLEQIFYPHLSYIDRMTISDYNTKPVRGDRAIYF